MSLLAVVAGLWCSHFALILCGFMCSLLCCMYVFALCVRVLVCCYYTCLIDSCCLGSWLLYRLCKFMYVRIARYGCCVFIVVVCSLSRYLLL